jgi:1,2-diacylglycerol 3-beta-galactosyltransferase
MNIQPTKTILILMSDTGGGHRTIAESLREAVSLLYPERYSVVIEDLFRQGAWPAPLLPEVYLPLITYTPWAWRRAFRWTTGPHSLQVVKRLLAHRLTMALRRLYGRYQPALVVSTHPMMTSAALRTLREEGSLAPFVAVVTDMVDVHPLWFDPEADMIIVPNTEVAACGVEAGVPRAQLRVVPPPINPIGFRDPRSKREIRAEIGLDPQLPAALLVGGAEGMGHLYAIAKAISAARLPLQLVVVAGRNAALRRKLEATAWDIPVRITGFVTNMPVWMRAADLIITKAGPMTIMEALAAGLPILLSGYVPGQEEGNVRFVEQNAVGVLRTTPRAMVEELRAWLAPDNDIMARMQARAHALAHPGAALDIAALLVEQIEQAGNRTTSTPEIAEAV